MSARWEEMRDRRATVRAVVLSLLAHVVLILAVAWFLAFEPPMRTIPAADEPVELTIVEPPPEPAPTPYLATTESQRAATPPDKPAFESDKDTRAASELPAEGVLPLPTQAGEERPGTDFENREYTPGPQERAATTAQTSQPAAPAPPAQTAPPEPLPPPPTSEIALLEPARRAQQPPRPETAQRPREAAQTSPSSPPGFQPQTRVTRLKGGISNRGRAAADAVATPLGRYKKNVSDAIGSRWYYYVNEQVGLLTPGTVELRFVVRPDGGVERVQVLRNSSNESFASTSVRAVMDAEIPPIPEEMQSSLDESSIEVDFTFTILAR